MEREEMRHANAKRSRVSNRVTKQIARAGPWHGRPKKILSSRSIIVKRFSWRVSNRVGKAVPKKLGDAGAPAPWHGAWVIVRNTPLPTCVTVTNLVVLRQTVRAYITEVVGKNATLASRLSRSLKVIGTDTDRSATRDFLLLVHSNHGPSSYFFPGKWRFRSKIGKFCSSCIFNAPADVVPLGI